MKCYLADSWGDRTSPVVLFRPKSPRSTQAPNHIFLLRALSLAPFLRGVTILCSGHSYWFQNTWARTLQFSQFDGEAKKNYGWQSETTCGTWDSVILKHTFERVAIELESISSSFADKRSHVSLFGGGFRPHSYHKEKSILRIWCVIKIDDKIPVTVQLHWHRFFWKEAGLENCPVLIMF